MVRFPPIRRRVLLGLRSPGLFLAAALAFVAARASDRPSAPTPTALRVVAPQKLTPGTRHLVRIEVLMPRATQWQAADPELFEAAVTGDAQIASDPSGRPTNPFEIEPYAAHRGEAALTVRYADLLHEERLQIAPQAPQGALRLAFGGRCALGMTRARQGILEEASPSPPAASCFQGIGIAMPSAAEAWESRVDESPYGWCFGDAQASMLQIAIQPTLEPENDNDDWQQTDAAKFNFTSLDRVLSMVRQAQQAQPNVRVYASLEGLPAWIAAGREPPAPGVVGGKALSNIDVARESAEHLWAVWQYASSRGVDIDYMRALAPAEWRGDRERTDGDQTEREGADWEAAQAADRETAWKLHDETLAALEQLAAQRGKLAKSPQWIFPEELGPRPGGSERPSVRRPSARRPSG